MSCSEHTVDTLMARHVFCRIVIKQDDDNDGSLALNIH